jgi:hypothetical protein
MQAERGRVAAYTGNVELPSERALASCFTYGLSSNACAYPGISDMADDYLTSDRALIEVTPTIVLHYHRQLPPTGASTVVSGKCLIW